MSLAANAASLREALRQPGNDRCADCRAPQPSWASYNIGVFVCQDCAGIHRSLGSHVSKVRSVNLDFWDSETVDKLVTSGNIRINSVMESSLKSQDKISPTANSSARSAFIQAKYVEKRFAKVDSKHTKIISPAVDMFFGLNLRPSSKNATRTPYNHQTCDLLALGYASEVHVFDEESDKRPALSHDCSSGFSSFSFINRDAGSFKKVSSTVDRVDSSSDALLLSSLFDFN